MKKLHKEKYRLETTRKTRVKLHKSGKNWVRTIMTQFGFVRLKGTDIKSPIKVKQSYLDAGRLLRGVISAGALVGGVHVLDEAALAEEANVVMASEVTNQTTLATTDTVVLSTSEVIVDTSRLSSFLTLLQDSLSHEIKVGYGETYDQYQLAREDAKQLVTEAQELLQVGASNQEIVDALTIKLEESFHVLDKLTEELSVESSQSESLSLSASVSLSESMAESDSVSLSEAISHSEVTSVSETVSQSETVSESEVLVDTTEIAVDISKLVAVQTSLEDALSKQVADTVDTNSSKYQKYLTAKAVAEQALAQVQAYLASPSQNQTSIDQLTLSAGQAAINLSGRYTQLVGVTGIEGTGVRATTTGANGTEISSSGTVDIRRNPAAWNNTNATVDGISYSYNASTNEITYTITLGSPYTRPILGNTNRYVGFSIGFDPTSTLTSITGTVTPSGRTDLDMTGATNNPDTSKGVRVYFDRPLRTQEVVVIVTLQTNGDGMDHLYVRAATDTNLTNAINYVTPLSTLPREINRLDFTETLLIDNVTPNAPVINDTISTVSTSVSGTAEAGTTLTVSFTTNGVITTATTTVGADGTWSVPVPSGTVLTTSTVVSAKTVDASDKTVDNSSAVSTATVSDGTAPVFTGTQNIYVFRGVAMTNPIQVTNISDSESTISSARITLNRTGGSQENGQGLSVSTTGVISGTVNSSAGLGSYTNQITATNSANVTGLSNSFVEYVMDVQGGNL